MYRFNYPIKLTEGPDDGGFVVTYWDLSEAITQGDTVEECLVEAGDCLEKAIAAHIEDNLEIPLPSKLQKAEKSVFVPLQTAFKASLYLAMKENGISKVELARQLHTHEKEVRRILDPPPRNKTPRYGKSINCPRKACGTACCLIADNNQMKILT